jgi:hypothetical protein
VVVGIRISVRLATASCREVGAGVVSLTLPARDTPTPLEVDGKLSGVGEAAVAGMPRAGVDDLDDSDGDNLRFLLIIFARARIQYSLV